MAIVNSVKAAINNPAYKSVATYVFTNFFSKGVSFLLLPLFTNPKYLTPTDNGLLSLFSSNLMLLAPFICLGMIPSANADFFKKSKTEFASSFSANFFISFGLTILAIVFLFLFKDYLQQKFQFPSSFIYIIPSLAFLIFCNEQFFALVRNRNEVKKYAVLGITKTFIEYTISVVLIFFFFKGWQGRVWGIAISLIATNLFAAYYYIKNNYLIFSFKKQHLWYEIKFGVPVFAFQLCVFMLGSTNKLFLAIYNVDKYQLGIYAVACVFGALVGTVSQSILLYAQPRLYRLLSSGQATVQSIKKEFLRFFAMLTAIAVPCVVVVLFLYHYVINKIYLNGVNLFLIVALSSFIWGLNNFLFLLLLYYKEKKQILSISLISIFFSVIINMVLVKKYLITGDAMASLINTIIFGVLVVLFIKTTFKKTLSNNFKPFTQPHIEIVSLN